MMISEGALLYLFSKEITLQKFNRRFKVRKLILLSLVTFLCLPLAVYASSIGGAETQGKGKVAVGLDQEFVFDRDMKLKSGYYWEEDDTIEDKTEIDKMYRTMVKTSYGVFDNLDVYVKLGTADFDGKSSYTIRDVDGSYEIGSLKIKGNNAFAYGFGMKGKYNLENDWIVGCDVQYLRHQHDVKFTDSWTDYNPDGSVDEVDSGSGKGKVTFQEWHIAPYIARKIGNFLPYFGVRYSDLRTNYKIPDEDSEDPDSIPKFKADDNVGIFIGTDFKITDNWKLNLEGRFVDETAMSLGATYKF